MSDTPMPFPCKGVGRPRQGTAEDAATPCEDNRQQCRNHLLQAPSFYIQPTKSERHLWTSVRQGKPYWGSREWHPITRYAGVLHSLTVIPYTAPLPLSGGDNGGTPLADSHRNIPIVSL